MITVTKEQVGNALFNEIGSATTLRLESAKTIGNQAIELVSRFVGSSEVPETVQLAACLTVARDLHTASQAPGGVYSPFGDGGAVRLARDPMKGAYPMLAPFVEGGFA
ncbi:hypothetical protein RQN30_02315 [Arcanobacterium hippocoleae]